MNKDKLIKRRIQDAEKFQSRGHHDRALTLYEHVLRLEPNHETALLNRYKCLIATNPPKYAIKEGDELVKLIPENADFWMSHGIVCSQAGEYDKAEHAYKKCIKLEPDNYRALHNLGSLVFQSGKDDEAISLLEQSVKIRPDYQIGYVTLFTMHHQKERYDKAISAGEQAFELIEPEINLLHCLADCYFEVGNFSRARTLYSDVIIRLKEETQKFGLHFPIVDDSMNYDHIGEYSGDDQEQLIASYYRIVLTLLRKRTFESDEIHELESAITHILQKNPNHVYATLAMAELLVKNKKYDEALSFVKKAEAIMSEDNTFLLQKATILMELHQYEEAHQIYTKILANDPVHFGALLGEAIALSQLGKKDEGIKLMETIAKINPSFIDRIIAGSNMAAQGSENQMPDLSLQKRPNRVSFKEKRDEKGNITFESQGF
ncbi:tetratricopeptide repeat protein [Methanospirillum stamsii]|uniref:Uncharacterized protein n=1 Tax=Methanospirillum stamsii TaxID=1277351 RepID=A0A2V2NL16_9EURY|nr:tetratricopeptide repeat protein [Methanospirillum stamsii]PWR76311.1 hypothetical protein DLD82_00440 [Methanospirillum stamsii]